MREDKRKEKKIIYLNSIYIFYLNNPIKSRRFDFVMDKIEILNVLHSGPPKVALTLYGFFHHFCPIWVDEKSGPR